LLPLTSSNAAPAWVGLTLQGGVGRLACVERPAEGLPRVTWVGQAPTAAGAAEWRALARQAGSRRAGWVAVLAVERYRLLAQDAPDLPRTEWADALRWRLKDVVDFPVDTAAIDVLAVPGPTESSPPRSVLVAIASAEAVKEVSTFAERARLPLAAIDVVETALRNLCALQGDAPRARALLWLGEASAYLVVTLRGELLMTRQIDVGLARLNSAVPEEQAAAHERVALEVQRTLDLCERLFSHANTASLAVVPCVGAAELVASLAGAVYIPVALLPMHEQLDFSAVPALANVAAQAEYAIAIGSALREAPAEAA
jgi:MSHA biogenesis protein MshI